MRCTCLYILDLVISFSILDESLISGLLTYCIQLIPDHMLHHAVLQVNALSYATQSNHAITVYCNHAFKHCIVTQGSGVYQCNVVESGLNNFETKITPGLVIEISKSGKPPLKT